MTAKQKKQLEQIRELREKTAVPFTDAFDQAMHYGTESEKKAIRVLTQSVAEARSSLSQGFTYTRNTKDMHRMLRLSLFLVAYDPHFIREARSCIQRLESFDPELDLTEEWLAVKALSDKCEQEIRLTDPKREMSQWVLFDRMTTG